MKNIWCDTRELIWKLLERHCFWITLFTFVIVAVENFCVLNFTIIILVSLALSLPLLSSLIVINLTIYLWSCYFFKIYQVCNLLKNVVHLRLKVESFKIKIN